MLLSLTLAAACEARGWRRLGQGLPQSGQWRQGFDLADLDGDGRLDLVHGPPRRGDGRPRIFLGDGRGGFSPWRQARFPELPLDYGAAVAADFTGDGRPDLALGAHLRGLTVLENRGGGAFVPWSEGLILAAGGGHFSSRALATVDWDRDGRPDLAALGEGPSPGADPAAGSYGLRLWLNGGDGRWRPVAADPESRLFGYSLARGDFDGDGSLDLVTASRSQGRSRVVHLRSSDGGVTRRSLPAARERSVLQAVTMLDADGDGDDEVATAYLARDPAGEWRAGIDLNDAAPSRREILSLRRSIEISVVAAGDLDGDGRPDLVAGGVGGRVWAFVGGADGRFRPLAAKPIERAADGCKASHARLVDLDGEAGDELIIAFASEPDGERCPGGGSIQVWTRR